MRYSARTGILFVVALFAARISPGILIEDHWYSFFWALFIGACNALIRSVFVVNNKNPSWGWLIIWASILNLFLYWLVYLGAVTWLGIYATTFGSALLSAAIVTVGSVIVNHFIGFKPSIK